MKAISKVIFIIILSCMIFVSCKTKEQLATCDNAVKATLIKKQVDGCTWLIQLEDGQILEPLNLKEFDIEKVEDKDVWINYENTQGYVSICMMGPIIRVKCISNR